MEITYWEEVWKLPMLSWKKTIFRCCLKTFWNVLWNITLEKHIEVLSEKLMIPSWKKVSWNIAWKMHWNIVKKNETLPEKTHLKNFIQKLSEKLTMPSWKRSIEILSKNALRCSQKMSWDIVWKITLEKILLRCCLKNSQDHPLLLKNSQRHFGKKSIEIFSKNAFRRCLKIVLRHRLKNHTWKN